MPETISMTAVLAIFYIVFLGQILLLSVYYPHKICSRVRYVIEQFPPAEYPKLYPGTKDVEIAENLGRWLRKYIAFNYCIAALGLFILIRMMITEYRPAFEGGDEIFVMFFFFLQMAPILYAEIKEYSYTKLLRENYKASKRTADLTPRHLFDYVSPVSLVVAILAYAAWITVYLSTREFGVQPDVEIYGTLIGMTAVQGVFAMMVYKNIYGRKRNPYMTDEDRHLQNEVIARVMLFASIGMSVFLTVTQMADDYSFEIFDPVLTSLYMQYCAVFGMGIALKTMQLDKMNFENYRGDTASTKV